MPDNEIFSGIPGLEDSSALEDYLNQETLKDLGIEPNQNQVPNNQETQQQQPQQNQAPQFTSEDIQNIIAKNQELESRMNQFTQNYGQRPQGTGNTQAFNNLTAVNRQNELIKQALDRGIPLDKIVGALQSRNSTDAEKSALYAKVQQIEQYLQQQQLLMQQQRYEAELNSFVTKMNSFGDKFGLSEKDLITFGERALQEGINISTVRDLETVFRALYPEQYSIRSQRLSNQNASQIFGGSNMQETPRTAQNKAVDAYVESFLRQTMPNQYDSRNKT